MQNTKYIGPFQFAVILTASYLGFGIFQFPRELMGQAGPDALYSLILELAWPLAGLWLWFRVNRLYPDRSIFAFAGEYITPFFGWVLVAVTVLLHLALAVVALANFGFLLRTFFLPSTPVWAIDGATLGAGVYMAYYGLAPLARSMGLAFLMPVMMSVALGFLLWGHIDSAYALIPSGQIHLIPILLGTYHSAYIFFGFKITSNVYRFVRPGERRRAERYGYRAIVFAFLFFFYGYILGVGVEGPYLLLRLEWPLVSVNRLVSVSGLFINKLGLLVVVFWGIILLSFESLRHWSLAQDLIAVLPHATITTYRLMLLGIGVVVFGCAQLIPNITYLGPVVQQGIVPAMLIYTFAVPGSILAGDALKRAFARRRERKRNGAPLPSEG